MSKLLFFCSNQEVQLLLQNVHATALTTSPHSCLNRQLLVLLLPLLTCSIYPSNQAAFQLTGNHRNVTALPKKKSHTSSSNYCPISLLPVKSKVLEHHIHSVLVEQLSDSNPISDRQWGFQAHNQLLKLSWLSPMTGFRVWMKEGKSVLYSWFKKGILTAVFTSLQTKGS